MILYGCHVIFYYDCHMFFTSFLYDFIWCVHMILSGFHLVVSCFYHGSDYNESERIHMRCVTNEAVRWLFDSQNGENIKDHIWGDRDRGPEQNGPFVYLPSIRSGNNDAPIVLLNGRNWEVLCVTCIGIGAFCCVTCIGIGAFFYVIVPETGEWVSWCLHLSWHCSTW